MKRDFLQLSDLSPDEHRTLFQRARELKSMRRSGEPVRTLEGRSLLLLFEKASTRTRISFEAAIGQLGGNAITLPTAESQIARGETLEDTARVASRYVDAIMFRTHGDDRLRAFARAATVPVINGLSDGGHPVQILSSDSNCDWPAPTATGLSPRRCAALTSTRMSGRRSPART